MIGAISAARSSCASRGTLRMASGVVPVSRFTSNLLARAYATVCRAARTFFFRFSSFLKGLSASGSTMRWILPMSTW